MNIDDEFPYLLNNEFLLVGSISSIDDIHSKLNNKEILQLVKNRVNTYLQEFTDINFKSLFIENLPNYAKEIGFENTIDILLPVIMKIVGLI
jgi:hypothetical protein